MKIDRSRSWRVLIDGVSFRYDYLFLRSEEEGEGEGEFYPKNLLASSPIIIPNVSTPFKQGSW